MSVSWMTNISTADLNATLTQKYREFRPLTMSCLWNENTARLTQMRPFNPPGIFVEFLPGAVVAALSRCGAWRYDCEAAFRNATLAQTDTPYRDEALCRFRLSAPSNSPSERLFGWRG